MLKLVPPFSIVGGDFMPVIQLAAPGNAEGIMSNVIITTMKDIFVIVLGEWVTFFRL
jgi:hypothetical protein